MYTFYLKYNTLTGQILNKLLIPDNEDVNLQPKESNEAFVLITTEDYNYVDEKYYYTNGAIMPRPYFPIVQDNKHFTNIPTNITVKMVIGESEYNVTDNTVDLTIDTPGTYDVIFKGFPYLDTTFQVVIT